MENASSVLVSGVHPLGTASKSKAGFSKDYISPGWALNTARRTGEICDKDGTRYFAARNRSGALNCIFKSTRKKVDVLKREYSNGGNLFFLYI